MKKESHNCVELSHWSEGTNDEPFVDGFRLNMG